jgi:hypothetical protein
MRRSVGVSVIAVLSLLGSAFTLLMGVLMLFVFFLAPPPRADTFPGSPAFFKAIMIGAALVYMLPAGWGIASSIGLFKLKNWARISILIFSVLLIVMSLFGGLTSLVMAFFPLPSNQDLDPSIMARVSIFMAVFWSGFLGVGIWWLVFFNRAKVKQQFVPAQPALAIGPSIESPYPMPDAPVTAATSPARRPLSLTILAWFMLVGCLFIPVRLLLHYPAVLLTRLVTGWPAAFFFIAVAALQLFIGIGLLRVKPAARTVAVAYYLFLFVNSAVFYLAPGARLRMLDLMQRSQAMFPWMQPWPQQGAFPFDATPFLILGACGGLIGLLVPLYSLITRKQAFEKAAAELAR